MGHVFFFAVDIEFALGRRRCSSAGVAFQQYGCGCADAGKDIVCVALQCMVVWDVLLLQASRTGWKQGEATAVAVLRVVV